METIEPTHKAILIIASHDSDSGFPEGEWVRESRLIVCKRHTSAATVTCHDDNSKWNSYTEKIIGIHGSLWRVLSSDQQRCLREVAAVATYSTERPILWTAIGCLVALTKLEPATEPSDVEWNKYFDHIFDEFSSAAQGEAAWETYQRKLPERLREETTLVKASEDARA